MTADLPRYGAAAAPVDPWHAARAVLAQSRFRVLVAPTAHRTWWDAVREWTGDRWNELMRALFHNVHVGAKDGALIGDVLLFALIALVVIVAVRLIWNSLPGARVGFESSGPAGVRDANTLYALSVAAAHRADYTRAILILFQAAVVALDIRGVVRDDPTQTVNECRRQIRAKAPGLAQAFDAIARPFTAVLYADEPATESQWNSAREAFARWIDADA